MFKDTDEALARLEAELLMEDAPPEEPVPEEEDQEAAPPEYFYQDTWPSSNPTDYENYANGYQAYNTDDTDEDLDDYSDEVRRGSSSSGNTVLILILCFLSLGVTAVLLLWLLHFRGVL